MEVWKPWHIMQCVCTVGYGLSFMYWSTVTDFTGLLVAAMCGTLFLLGWPGSVLTACVCE